MNNLDQWFYERTGRLPTEPEKWALISYFLKGKPIWIKVLPPGTKSHFNLHRTFGKDYLAKEVLR